MNTFEIQKVKQLQEKARTFLKENYLEVNGIAIHPKEIEVYYFKKNEFEDPSVHQNELQRNMSKKYHLYVHRKGKSINDTYIGGIRDGVDLCIPITDDSFFTFLIRGAAIKDKNEMVQGPNKVLKSILTATNMTKEELETSDVIIKSESSESDIYFSERIGLGKVPEEYKTLKLRAVLSDEYFKTVKGKESMIVSFIKENLHEKDKAIDYTLSHLGYIPKKIKDLFPQE